MSTVYLIIVFFDKKIKLWEVIGFYVIYLIYVLVRSPIPPHHQIVILFRKQSSDVYEDLVPPHTPLLPRRPPACTARRRCC